MPNRRIFTIFFLKISGWICQMLWTSAHDHKWRLGRKNRAQISSGQTTSARKNGPRNYASQDFKSQIRGQVEQFLRRLQLCLHHPGIMSATIPHGTAQKTKSRDRARNPIFYESDSSGSQIFAQSENNS